MEGTEVQNASEYPVEKLNRLPKTVSSNHSPTSLHMEMWPMLQAG